MFTAIQIRTMGIENDLCNFVCAFFMARDMVGSLDRDTANKCFQKSFPSSYSNLRSKGVLEKAADHCHKAAAAQLKEKNNAERAEANQIWR